MSFKKTIKMDKFLDEMHKEYRKVAMMIDILKSEKERRIYGDKLITINFLCKQISNCRIMLLNKRADHWVAYECDKYKTIKEWRVTCRSN